MLKAEIVRGALVGAHLHPEYIEPNSQWGEEIDKVVLNFLILPAQQ